MKITMKVTVDTMHSGDRANEHVELLRWEYLYKEQRKRMPRHLLLAELWEETMILDLETGKLSCKKDYPYHLYPKGIIDEHMKSMERFNKKNSIRR